MPANLTPQYEKADRRFKEAETHEEKLLALEEMLRVIPKHKGTDRMQGDLKRKLSKLRQTGGKKSGGRQIDIWHVPRGGGGRVALLGCPNVGKSALVAALTNAHVTVAEFPFSTHTPAPGIMHHEDVPIQLIDLPPVTPEHIEPGMWGLVRGCDVLLLVVDLASPELLDQVETVLDVLASRTLKPVSVTNPEKPDDPEAPQPVRALLIGNKTDIAAPGDLEGLEEMYGDGIRLLGVSAETGEGLDALRKAVFDLLGVMRVYCKQPGKEADVAEPFVLPIGGTVADFAELVHRDFPDRLKFARLWGRDKFQGIQVHGDYVLGDRDVLELHVR